jgi:hypothetical protein
MAGGAETPNIAALPAIARLGARESAWGPDADRHVKLLIQFAVKGALSGAYSQITSIETLFADGTSPAYFQSRFGKPCGTPVHCRNRLATRSHRLSAAF